MFLIDAQVLLNPMPPGKFQLKEDKHHHQNDAAQNGAEHNQSDRAAVARLFCGDPILQQQRFLLFGLFRLVAVDQLLKRFRDDGKFVRRQRLAGGLEAFRRP